MIVTARSKRDKHLILIAKMEERKRRKNTIICAADPIGAARVLREEFKIDQPGAEPDGQPVGSGLISQ